MGEPILSQLGDQPSIVLVRLRSLGDTVLATPAFSLLRQALPHAHINVVMEERFADVLSGHPDINGVLRIGSQTGILQKARLIQSIRSLQASLCLDMHGGSTAAWLTALSGAHWRAGYEHFRHKWAYNFRIPRAQQVLNRASEATVHTVEHHASAMIHLGAQSHEIPPARLALVTPEPHQPYAVIHPEATFFTKQWSINQFRMIANEIRDQHHLEPVFVTGTDNPDLTTSLQGFNIRSGLTLPELMSLLAGAQLFLGNDSGPAHIAAAFNVPSVVIFGSSDSSIWHPWKTAHRIVETTWDCKPCPGDRCYAFEEPHCIQSVTTEAVSSAISELISECWNHG